MSFQIAIDGPVAAGKGTVSRLVAERLGFLYVDTGAMYRVAALLASRHNLKPTKENEKAIATLLKGSTIQLRKPTDDEKDERKITVLLNDEDVSWEIRQQQYGKMASIISELPSVRTILVAQQRALAEEQNVVMEGRDITSNVLPDADLKLFLTASETVRAKRRHLELLILGNDVNFSEVLADLRERDFQNTSRELHPLTKVPGVWVIDTSDLDIEHVVSIICESVKNSVA